MNDHQSKNCQHSSLLNFSDLTETGLSINNNKKERNSHVHRNDFLRILPKSPHPNKKVFNYSPSRNLQGSHPLWHAVGNLDPIRSADTMHPMRPPVQLEVSDEVKVLDVIPSTPVAVVRADDAGVVSAVR